MADSLRDQLIAAGFEAPKKEVKKTKKPEHGKKGRSRAAGNRSTGNNNSKAASARHSANKTTNKSKSKTQNSKAQNSKASSSNAESEAAIAERKKLKAQIKELIDNNKLENWKGEIAYRYTVEKRIRELYVNEAGQKQLTSREVAITRLNGDTYLVPIAVATEITTINPQWSVFNTADAEEDIGNQSDDYAEFQVPDDLQW